MTIERAFENVSSPDCPQDNESYFNPKFYDNECGDKNNHNQIYNIARNE